ncbi:cyclin-dependent kinase 20 isoform X2 [Manis pentadactyla]|uniref:cyclin-dependent kinase 20 isoform X2 n=1 Tax=Manis pentadactyla TaxID=143292 RepID=UPI00255CED61|nr:cyclin-dependent kinase 20 isoform X2 [Manis pentadactyla]
MDQYCILGRIGEGAHGIVFKAKHVETGEIVALKKVALRRLGDGISSQALREIKALQEMEDSPYVVQLKAVFPHGACLVLAFEFMLSDLAEVLRHAQGPLVQAQVKSYLQMLLRGVAFCHSHNIVHRVSPSMGWRLETSQPAHQCLGPAQDSRLWPGPGPLPRWQLPLHTPGGHQEITELPDYNKISFKDQAPMPLGELLPDAPPQALDLLGHFLRYPPRQRIAASQALLHPYFFTAPLPDHPSELLIPQRPRGSTPEAHPGPSHGRDFNVDRPLEESLLDPELIRPFIPEG